MDGESGLSSGNKNAGILSITVNIWVPTGKPHCLQPECVLYRHNSVLLTAKFQITILGNDQLDALFRHMFILCLYMFQAASAHHQEGQTVLIHNPV
jgi:hypothetical protein